MLLYDDSCPLCTFQMKTLTWLDWFKKLEMRPLSDASSRAELPGIEPEMLRAAIHCRSKDGEVFRGARALRFVGMRLPPAAPLAAVLWIPGIIPIAEVVYMWVSRNRHFFSRIFGCKEACAILPERKSHME